MKKLLALTIALTMVCGTVGCGEKPKSQENPTLISEETKLILNSADIQMGDNFKDIVCISQDPKSGKIMTFGELQNGGYAGFISDSKFGDYEQFRFTLQEGETIYNASLLSMGRKVVLTYFQGETLIYLYDRENNLKSTINCGELLPEETYAKIFGCDDGFMINQDNSMLYFISENGENTLKIDLGMNLVHGVSLDSEGIPTVVYSQDGKTYTAQISEMKWTNKQECSSVDTTFYAVSSGMGDYKLIAIYNGSLWGLKDNNWNLLCDFLDNDFIGSSIHSIAMTGENEFAVVVSTANGAEMKLLTQADISALESKTVIRVANLAGGDLSNEPAKIYNSRKPDSQYRIEIKNYGAIGDYEQGVEAMNQDILSGNAPDVLIFNSYINPKLYGARESIFVDFYTLLDKDEDISRDDFMDGILEGLEHNGKLLEISPTFTLNTMIAKDKYLNGLESWNMEQFMEIVNSLPDDMQVYESYKTTMTSNFMELVDYSSYVDYENAACHFDDETFIKSMNLVRDNHFGMTSEEHDIWLESINGGIQEFDNTDFINDEMMIYNLSVSGWLSLRETMLARFNEPATLIGYPSESGNGSYISFGQSYGIMANSTVIEGAWDYLKTVYFSDEYYSASGIVGGKWSFPTIEEKYLEKIEEVKSPYYTNELGEQVKGFDFPIGMGENDIITYYELSDEQCAEYDAIIRNAIKNVQNGDNVIRSILLEELMPFFEGDSTADKTVENIQNRVTIYLSERYT